MRWDLNRITKLAGVVEIHSCDYYESEDGESSDEEDEGEEEDEVNTWMVRRQMIQRATTTEREVASRLWAFRQSGPFFSLEAP